MNRLLSGIIKKATWKTAALFAVLFAAFYVWVNYSQTGVAGLLGITGGANILDFEFGYTYEKAYNMLTALGAEGRSFYLTRILPMDFPFPFVYMLFFAGLIALLLKHLKPKEICRYLLIIPVLTMLFDWTENIGIITLLNTYPGMPVWAVSTASIAGMLKTVFLIGSIAVIGILFIFLLWSKARFK